MEMYKEFKRYFGNRSISTDLLMHIQKSQLEERVMAFYPEDWFGKEKPGVTLFTHKDIISIKKDTKVLSEIIYKNYKVTKLDYLEHLNDRYAGSKLTITLDSGEQLIFDASKVDDEDYIQTFSSYIKMVYEFLKEAS
ncbi:hypothetical protein [Paenibacillus xylanexedens]|uniref:YokE-like PH domain-containing protein n=1 Tax=Paenibacillus xylanexedens TaxID=528191 RepID=A0ABS4S2F9_PAEXY|nr:hypothetical protein [Paenibacillus xylanexedens]MBP2249313.1 hypothetical protein [Paenibacillus xylanexedens]